MKKIVLVYAICIGFYSIGFAQKPLGRYAYKNGGFVSEEMIINFNSDGKGTCKFVVEFKGESKETSIFPILWKMKGKDILIVNYKTGKCNYEDNPNRVSYSSKPCDILRQKNNSSIEYQYLREDDNTIWLDNLVLKKQ